VLVETSPAFFCKASSLIEVLGNVFITESYFPPKMTSDSLAETELEKTVKARTETKARLIIFLTTIYTSLQIIFEL